MGEFITYILYSIDYDKIYIGYTSNLEQRLLSHNQLATKGFTIKYRPWILVYKEIYHSKQEAMLREKQLKTANGRKFVREITASLKTS